MRVAIDARGLATAYENRGVGYHIKMLLRRLPGLAPDVHFIYFLLNEESRRHVPAAPNAEGVVLNRSWKHPWAEDCVKLPFEMRRARADVFHCPVVLGPLRSVNIPLVSLTPVISTVHDLHVEMLDDSHMEAYRKERRYRVQRRAVTGTRIVTVSDFTRRMLAEHGIEGTAETEVIPNCADREPVPADTSKENMVLFVGDAVHKNTQSAIQVFKALSERAAGWRFVMVGSAERIYSLGGLYAKELQAAGILQIEENVPDQIVNELYRRARILFMPSLSEGFGLPLLHAFVNRAAAVVSDRGALPEVGGDAAVIVDPENVFEMASTLEGLMRNETLRAELVRRGVERLKAFDYRAVLGRLIDLYREAAGK